MRIAFYPLGDVASKGGEIYRVGVYLLSIGIPGKCLSELGQIKSFRRLKEDANNNWIGIVAIYWNFHR